MKYLVLLAIGAAVASPGDAGEGWVIAESGESPYVIVYPADCPPVVEKAAVSLGSRA